MTDRFLTVFVSLPKSIVSNQVTGFLFEDLESINNICCTSRKATDTAIQLSLKSAAVACYYCAKKGSCGVDI